MKKIYLIILALIATTQISFGQWTTSGTNINNSNTGNVGIGTTSPQTKLHVVGGEIRLAGQGSSGVNSTSFISFYDSNNSTRYGWLGDGGPVNSDITLYADAGNSLHFATNGVNDRMFISTTGYVGIGTITPGRPLDVNGLIQTNTGLTFNNGKVWDIASNGNNLFFNETTIGTRMTFLAGGNVGIGTLNPGALLNVNGSGSNSNGILDVQSTDVGANGTLARIGFYQYTSQDNAGSYYQSWGMRYNGSDHLWYRTYTAANNYLPYTELSTTGTIVFGGAASNATTDANPTPNPTMTINVGTPSVSIGTTNPQGHMFAVNGSAIATSMTVKLNANWPDYVFTSDYKLPSLQNVKKYIDQNQHLPEMPSASYVEKNGLNLGEMNRLLTKKVEELTLYLIEKDKKEKEQERINQDLKDRLDRLEKKINGQ